MNDQRSPNPNRFHADEDGLVSLVSCVAVLGFLVLFAILANVGTAVNRKVEVQTGADAAAATGATQLARGMNQITAINHLAGELHGLVVIHHAFGGDELEGSKRAPATPLDVKARFELAYRVADVVAAQETQIVLDQSYDAIKGDPDLGATLWDCRVRLKKVATWAYIVHAVGGFLVQFKWIPIIGQILEAVGHTITAAASVFEGKALAEWKTLDGLTEVVTRVQPFKAAIQQAILPALAAYSAAIARTTMPAAAAPAVKQTGQKNGVTAALDYRFPLGGLPVVAEPSDLDEGRSQLMRASTPWTQYWRDQWMQFGKDALLLARFDAYYFKQVDEWQRTLTKRAKADHGTNLLVLEGTDLAGAGKGAEAWTRADGSGEADRLFGVVGFAHRAARPVAGGRIFRQPTPDGVVAYAQALVYNANPQQPDAAPAGWQRRVGWDTLNWAIDVPEYPGPGDRDAEPARIPQVPKPQIRLNWQAKLVPATPDRLGAAVRTQSMLGPAEMGRAVRRTDTDLTLARTH